MALTLAEKRGIFFLGSCILTCIIMAAMMDGFVEEEYGLAFVPIYVFWCAVLVEQIMAVPRYQVVIAENNINAKSYRFSPRWWGGMLNACLWLVVFVLLELYLYEVDTVPAVSFIYLIVLWACLSILATFWKHEFLKPFSLYNTANYVCDIQVDELASYESYMQDRMTAPVDSSSGFGESNLNIEDDDSLFHEQVGTVRGMSVNESVRNSINSSPTRIDDEIEVLVNELSELEEKQEKQMEIQAKTNAQPNEDAEAASRPKPPAPPSPPANE